MGVFRRLFEGRRKLFWLLAGSVFVVDQVTKALLWQHPGGPRSDIVIIPHVLQIISHAGNVRGALGLGPSRPLFYILAATVGLAAVTAFFFTTDSLKTIAHLALGMLAGGALGNLLDRIARGFVRDFVDFHWGDSFHWHTFNVADAAICVGFVLIVYDTFFCSSEGRAKEKATAPPQKPKKRAR